MTADNETSSSGSSPQPADAAASTPSVPAGEPAIAAGAEGAEEGASIALPPPATPPQLVDPGSLYHPGFPGHEPSSLAAADTDLAAVSQPDAFHSPEATASGARRPATRIGASVSIGCLLAVGAAVRTLGQLGQLVP